MKLKLISVMIVLTMTVVLLSGCGGNSAGESNQSGDISTNTENVSSSGQDKSSKSSKGNNVEKTLELMKSVLKEHPLNPEDKSSMGYLLGYINALYKKDIENSYNKSTKLTVGVNEPSLKFLAAKENYKKDVDNNVVKLSVWLEGSTELKLNEVDKSQIVMGCNENNKGMVIAIAFYDGFYLYQVDQNGNKTNEITYMFE